MLEVVDLLLEIVDLLAVRGAGRLALLGGELERALLGLEVVELAILLEMPGATIIAAIALKQLPPAGIIPAVALMFVGIFLVIRSGSRTVPSETAPI